MQSFWQIVVGILAPAFFVVGIQLGAARTHKKRGEADTPGE